MLASHIMQRSQDLRRSAAAGDPEKKGTILAPAGEGRKAEDGCRQQTPATSASIIMWMPIAASVCFVSRSKPFVTSVRGWFVRAF